MKPNRTWILLLETVLYLTIVGCSVPRSSSSTQTTTTIPVASPVAPVGLTYEDDLAVNPPAPKNLKAVITDRDVYLAWDESSKVLSPHSYRDEIAYYRIFRRTLNETEPVFLGRTETRDYTDTPAPCGAIYYLVTAVHIDDNESSRPNEIPVKVECSR